MRKPKNQLRDDNFDRKKYKYTGKLTYEILDQFLEDMVPTESPVIFMAYCKTRGFTKFTAGTGLCGDSECGICPDIKKVMRENLPEL